MFHGFERKLAPNRLEADWSLKLPRPFGSEDSPPGSTRLRYISRKVITRVKQVIEAICTWNNTNLCTSCVGIDRGAQNLLTTVISPINIYLKHIYI